jgi:hypothetical protein
MGSSIILITFNAEKLGLIGEVLQANYWCTLDAAGSEGLQPTGGCLQSLQMNDTRFAAKIHQFDVLLANMIHTRRKYPFPLSLYISHPWQLSSLDDEIGS